MDSQSPIGLFDSGLGGLTVLKELRDLLPHERYVYLGDTARAPYGSKSSETISRYALECQHFLEEKGVKLLVVACNTASSVAIDELSRRGRVPVIGTIESAVAALKEVSNLKRVAVLGTRATIASGAYQRKINAVFPAVKIVEQACPLFVPLVEEGQIRGSIVDGALELYLRGVKSEGVDAVILGCTHYPLLSQAIGEYLGSGVALVECSKVIARQVKQILGSADQLSNASSGGESYFVTDEVSRFNSLANLISNRVAINAVKVDELTQSHSSCQILAA